MTPTAKIYTKADGSIYGVGELLRKIDMAKTYRRITTKGVEDFYSGEIAHQIDADMSANGGLITMQDLADCKTLEVEPLWTGYRGHKIATNQPPGGGLMIVIMLNILENFDLRAMGHNSTNYLATVSEAMKIATVNKDTRMGDPHFVDIPLEELTSKVCAKKWPTGSNGVKRHPYDE